MVIEPDSVERMAEAIEFLIDHPDDALAMAARGRVVAERNFDHTNQGAMLMEILKGF